MTGKLPQYLWMATGGKTNLSKVDVLKNRKVVAFPDTDGFDEWTERLTPYGFNISSALQEHLNDEEQKLGLDLADFVTKQLPKSKSDNRTLVETYFETLKDGRVIEMHPAGYPADWN